MITAVRNRLRRWKSHSALYLGLFMAQWRSMQRQVMPVTTALGPQLRLLIIPCDPWTVMGSRGDQAMIAGVVDTLRERIMAGTIPNSAAGASGLDVAIVVASQSAAFAVQQAGHRALRAWPVAQSELHYCVGRLRDYAPHVCVVLGADTMDGFYSPSSTLRLICLADLMARSGVRTCILGFSFNRKPVRQIAYAFRHVSPLLHLNLRDALSLERFERTAQAPARLVADAAFLMHPDASTVKMAGVRRFVASQQAAGRQVLGINAHPMLFMGRSGGPSGDRVARLQQALVHALADLLRQRPVALVLLSHDDRSGHGDAAFLRSLHDALAPEWADRVLLPPCQMNAPELKAAASLMHGVVSGRMHLAIAALGSGVPVAALTYQDKFEGLFAHFGLDGQWLLSGEAALQHTVLANWLLQFHDALPALSRQVRQRLPDVLRLAARNFDDLLQPEPVHKETS